MQVKDNDQVLRKTTSKTFRLRSRDFSTEVKDSFTPLKRPRRDELLDQEGSLGAEDDVGSSSKRHRTADWPLKNNLDVPAVDTRKSTSPAKPSSQPKGKSKNAIRPSKFQEGSLNDKPSKHPPPSYIGEDEAMEKYHSGRAGVGPNDSTSANGAIEPLKPSGMFRFGRAIASALNPTTVWQGINGIWREKDVAESEGRPQGDQEEINEAYAAFKHGGFQGMKTTNGIGHASHSQLDSSGMGSNTVQDPQRNSFRDSAIDMGDESNSNRPSQNIKLGSALNVPASPHLENSSSRRSFSQLRSPSFNNLKKVTSHIQLPSPRRKHSAVPIYPSIDSVVANDGETNAPGLKRQPSKKDIARVNKLNKRVSDLELKLETARQELKQSLRDAPPVPNVPLNVDRAPFVPGALGSLPSERLLDQRVESVARNASLLSPTKTSKAQIRSPTDIVEAFMTAPQSRLHDKPDTSKTRAKHMTTAVKSSNDRAARSKSASQKDVTAPSPAGITKKPLPKLPRAPRNSPRQFEDKVPPVPAELAGAFDSSTIDKDKILAMRSAPDRHTPLGKVGDDTMNIRKLYPSITEQQVNEFFAGFARDSRGGSRHILVQHSNRPVSPYLSHPRSPSSVRTRSRNQKRGISPPPPSLASAKKSAASLRGGEPQDDDHDSGPVPGRKFQETPKIALRRSSNRVNALKTFSDKPLPDVQKEDFQWDEDVF